MRIPLQSEDFRQEAGLAQLVERQTLNLVVAGSSPASGFRFLSVFEPLFAPYCRRLAAGGFHKSMRSCGACHRVNPTFAAHVRRRQLLRHHRDCCGKCLRFERPQSRIRRPRLSLSLIATFTLVFCCVNVILTTSFCHCLAHGATCLPQKQPSAISDPA